MNCGLDIVADIPFSLTTSEYMYTALCECGAVADGDWNIDEFGHTLDKKCLATSCGTQQHHIGLFEQRRGLA
jgi:hypothetical protein